MSAGITSTATDKTRQCHIVTEPVHNHDLDDIKKARAVNQTEWFTARVLCFALA